MANNNNRKKWKKAKTVKCTFYKLTMSIHGRLLLRSLCVYVCLFVYCVHVDNPANCFRINCHRFLYVLFVVLSIFFFRRDYLYFYCVCRWYFFFECLLSRTTVDFLNPMNIVWLITQREQLKKKYKIVKSHIGEKDKNSKQSKLKINKKKL